MTNTIKHKQKPKTSSPESSRHIKSGYFTQVSFPELIDYSFLDLLKPYINNNKLNYEKLLKSFESDTSKSMKELNYKDLDKEYILNLEITDFEIKFEGKLFNLSIIQALSKLTGKDLVVSIDHINDDSCESLSFGTNGHHGCLFIQKPNGQVEDIFGQGFNYDMKKESLPDCFMFLFQSV